MKLYGYWRSSASYRVRIALALKNIDYDYVAVNLLKGEHKAADYLAIHPNGLVPTLVTDEGETIVQSLAIMEYLEDVVPAPAILPASATERAHARAIAATIACEAQPFMNLRMQKFLKEEKSFDDAAMSDWLNRFTGAAMAAAEALARKTAGQYCVGDTPSIADCCLAPQWFGAGRFGVDVSKFTKLAEIYERCIKHPAFEKAHPKNQPDAVSA